MAKIPTYAEVSVPDLLDLLTTVDVSDTTDDATGSTRRITLARLFGAYDPSHCGGRLTLETGVPISTTDQTAKTSVFFTPYLGNRVCLYDGTRWAQYVFTERTLALGTLTADKQYDIFLFDNSGTLTLELSAAWTNDTTRADAIALQDGIPVKSGAVTRRLLGTIRTTATTTTEDSAVKRFVSNLYNTAARQLYKTDTTSHSYNGSVRQWNNSTANQVAFVLCTLGRAVSVGIQGFVIIGSSSGPALNASLDTVAAGFPMADMYLGLAGEARLSGNAVFLPTTIGYHFIAANERTVAAVNSTFGDFELSGVLHA